jgi:N-acetylglucosaminyldiphosphoundecaprenol N-acetyl-beta-D-mannosaminyltransferase
MFAFKKIKLLDSKISRYKHISEFFCGKIITFVNTFSYYKLVDSKCPLDKIDCVYVDGVLQVLLHNFFFRNKTARLSFDFSSLADEVFSYISKIGCNIALIGATDREINAAVVNIKNKYKGLNIVYYRDGYFAGDSDKYNTREILRRKKCKS